MLKGKIDTRDVIKMNTSLTADDDGLKLSKNTTKNKILAVKSSCFHELQRSTFYAKQVREWLREVWKEILAPVSGSHPGGGLGNSKLHKSPRGSINIICYYRAI